MEDVDNGKGNRGRYWKRKQRKIMEKGAEEDHGKSKFIKIYTGTEIQILGRIEL